MPSILFCKYMEVNWRFIHGIGGKYMEVYVRKTLGLQREAKYLLQNKTRKILQNALAMRIFVSGLFKMAHHQRCFGTELGLQHASPLYKHLLCVIYYYRKDIGRNLVPITVN